MIEHSTLTLTMGKQALPLGQLDHFHDGRRAYSQFSYASSWLEHPKVISVSPDLPLLPGPHIRNPAGPSDPSIFLALADTAPGPWARRVIEFVHHKARESNPRLAPLNELQYLRAVNDAHRVGAIRLVNGPPLPWWNHPPGQQATLEHLRHAVPAGLPMSAQLGQIRSIQMLLDHAPAFALDPDQARTVLAQVVHAVKQWQAFARSDLVQFPRDKLDAIKPLFENTRLAQAIGLCG